MENNFQDVMKQLVDVTQDMFISQMLLAGLPQQTVGKIARVDIVRVNRIGKILKKSKKKPA